MNFKFFRITDKNIDSLKKLLNEQTNNILHKKKIKQEEINHILSSFHFGWIKTDDFQNVSSVSSYILCYHDYDINVIYIQFICNKLQKDCTELLEVVEKYSKQQRFKFIQIEVFASKSKYFISNGYHIAYKKPHYFTIHLERKYVMRKVLPYIYQPECIDGG